MLDVFRDCCTGRAALRIGPLFLLLSSCNRHPPVRGSFLPNPPEATATAAIEVSGDSVGPVPVGITRAELGRVVRVVRDTEKDALEGEKAVITMFVVDTLALQNPMEFTVRRQQAPNRETD
jgi:hypothetical protein